MPDLRAPGNLAMLLLLLGSIAIWVKVLVAWSNGQSALDRKPREPCRWHGAAVGLALPVSFVVQLAVLSPISQADLNSLVGLQARCLAMLLEVLLLMGLLALGTPIRARDFGIDPSALLDDLQFGLAGFLASLVPVFAINYLVNHLGWRDEGATHPYFGILGKDPGPHTVGWIVLSAVILAPVAEELLYRVVLQGWLETRLTPRGAILFVSFLFAFVRIAPGRPDHLPLLPLALILGYVYERRHSYLTVVVLHAAFNATNLALALLMS